MPIPQSQCCRTVRKLLQGIFVTGFVFLHNGILTVPQELALNPIPRPKVSDFHRSWSVTSFTDLKSQVLSLRENRKSPGKGALPLVKGTRAHSSHLRISSPTTLLLPPRVSPWESQPSETTVFPKTEHISTPQHRLLSLVLCSELGPARHFLWNSFLFLSNEAHSTSLIRFPLHGGAEKPISRSAISFHWWRRRLRPCKEFLAPVLSLFIWSGDIQAVPTAPAWKVDKQDCIWTHNALLKMCLKVQWIHFK